MIILFNQIIIYPENQTFDLVIYNCWIWKELKLKKNKKTTTKRLGKNLWINIYSSWLIDEFVSTAIKFDYPILKKMIM